MILFTILFLLKAIIEFSILDLLQVSLPIFGDKRYFFHIIDD